MDLISFMSLISLNTTPLFINEEFYAIRFSPHMIAFRLKTSLGWLIIRCHRRSLAFKIAFSVGMNRLSDT